MLIHRGSTAYGMITDGMQVRIFKYNKASHILYLSRILNVKTELSLILGDTIDFICCSVVVNQQYYFAGIIAHCTQGKQIQPASKVQRKAMSALRKATLSDLDAAVRATMFLQLSTPITRSVATSPTPPSREQIIKVEKTTPSAPPSRKGNLWMPQAIFLPLQLLLARKW